MANRIRSIRKVREWGFVPGAAGDQTANNTFLATGSSAFGSVLTVVRMIGSVLISGTAGGTFAAADKAKITLGIGVFSPDCQ